MTTVSLRQSGEQAFKIEMFGSPLSSHTLPSLGQISHNLIHITLEEEEESLSRCLQFLGTHTLKYLGARKDVIPVLLQ